MTGEELPKARIKRRRLLRLVWIVPVIAIAIAAALVYQRMQDYGPQITVTFADGGGMRDELLFGLPEIREDLRRAALERLAAAIPDELRGRCPIFETVTNGKAWQQILRVAVEEQADLIVLGVTGRATADLLLFGSTTQQVLRQALCPVLTIRA